MGAVDKKWFLIFCKASKIIYNIQAFFEDYTRINRDSDYLFDFRGLPHGKALSLLPNNFSSVFKNRSLPQEGKWVTH
jgi:hypothetical protein